MFQKTVAINDYYFKRPDTPFPLGQIQSQGRVRGDHGPAGRTVWLARIARRLPCPGSNGMSPAASTGW